MKIEIYIRTVLFLLMSPLIVNCQEPKRIVVGNKLVSREIVIRNDSIIDESISLKDSKVVFLRKGGPGLGFLLNGIRTDGYSGWNFISTSNITNYNGCNGLSVRLNGKGKCAGLEIIISFITAPDIPVTRKWISFTNHSGADMKLEAVDVEKQILNFDYVSTWVYHDYCRMKNLGSYTGNWYDPLVIIHNTTLRAGIAIGNESPGVLKRIVFHTTAWNMEAGLTHPGQDFPFRKWLKPGETWESPAVMQKTIHTIATMKNHS